MKTRQSRREPLVSLNLPVVECKHWRALCLPLEVVSAKGDKAFDDCGGKVIYHELTSTDEGNWYWVFIVDIKNCKSGEGPRMPAGWDYRKFMR